ncbi:Uncharacterised protein [Acinetobacter junii]|uniref:DUF4124 domain-containing protein n=4 Tax=Acinetobacter junii TaxID=40215 RepID=UPI0002D07EC8|nr:DUF4124 domain-containing protein [Acinetobacter junii]ENV67057.1 hypothetical protein F948_01259 [Acinetobacter junii CIP 64.5]MDH1858128.1 DUF4124 domain-containing protein [Acinetobacter junii]SUU14747.1 Uncharacterised protein [Acinetobacter junii]SUU17283.1 Uncharacterised protein [Acinetobacter junii]
MIRGASWSFFSSILLCFSTSVFAQDLYKCVSPQGTTYQNHPCAAKTAQKTACMGTAVPQISQEEPQLRFFLFSPFFIRHKE